MSATTIDLGGLTPQQDAAARQPGAVLVLAGAGTGKTKTLTHAIGHRIGQRGMLASRILVVTFTNKAAAEMARRVRQVLGEDSAPRWIGTFHGLGARQLRIEPEVGGLRPGFDIVDADVYAEYQRVLRDTNAADFGDLLLWPTRAMQGNQAYRSRWSERFDAVLADEYQDVNYAQYTWLRLFGSRHGEIFVVGDDDQAVFGWWGSDIGYIRRFARDFPGAVQIKLEENFRSTGHILDAANAVIAQDRARLGKTLFTRKARGDRIEVVAFRDADAEASGIVAEMTRRHAEGVGWAEMAVLYRGNALSRGFEEALMRAHVPHVIVGDVGFYQRAEVKDALALLRLSVTPDAVQGDEAFRRVINTPARGFGPKAMAVVEDEAAWRQVSLLSALETADLPPKTRSAGLAFADALRGVGGDREATLAGHLSVLLDATGYRAMLRESRAETTEDRLDNLQELIQLAGGFHTARELLDHAALSSSGPNEEESGRVRLMTLHKSKGLEFGHVFLPAWEAGVFPPDYGDLSEERRLAYVAITRGMRRVTISHCGFRRGHAAPSCFLADVPASNRLLGWLRGPQRAVQRPSLVRQHVLGEAGLPQRF